MPILAKNPNATARDIKRTPSFNISLAKFFFIIYFSLANAFLSNRTGSPFNSHFKHREEKLKIGT
jgi:hypothetical protein